MASLVADASVGANDVGRRCDRPGGGLVQISVATDELALLRSSLLPLNQYSLTDDFMDPKKLIGRDERLVGVCVYCGGHPDTRDHVPAKILLDKPYPPDLPVVEACAKCNNSAEPDELYLACFLECVLSGTTDPDKLGRSRIAGKLAEQLALRTAIQETQRCEGNARVWEPDQTRVARVAIKLGQGHLAWELCLPALGQPSNSLVVPLMTMTPDERERFEADSQRALWPEINSRAFYEVIERQRDPFRWKEVQPGRYRYCVDQDDGNRARIVLSEYLACLIVWD